MNAITGWDPARLLLAMLLFLGGCTTEGPARVPNAKPLIKLTYADCDACTYQTVVDVYRNGTWHQHLVNRAGESHVGRITKTQVRELFDTARSYEGELLLVPNQVGGGSARGQERERYKVEPADVVAFRAKLIQMTGLTWDSPPCVAQCPAGPAAVPRGSVTFLDRVE